MVTKRISNLLTGIDHTSWHITGIVIVDYTEYDRAAVFINNQIRSSAVMIVIGDRRVISYPLNRYRKALFSNQWNSGCGREWWPAEVSCPNRNIYDTVCVSFQRQGEKRI